MTEIMPKVCKNPFSTLLAHSTVLLSESTLHQFDLLRCNAKREKKNNANTKRLNVISQQLKQTLSAKHKELHIYLG